MKKRMSIYCLLLSMILLAACSSTAPQSVVPGIDGSWLATLSPNGSITLELHPASGCAANAPCALTGTLKDNRDGMNGALSGAALRGNAVEFHQVLRLTSDDLTGRQYDFAGTLQPDGVNIKGELQVKGTAEAKAQSWQVEFKKQ